MDRNKYVKLSLGATFCQVKEQLVNVLPRAAHSVSVAFKDSVAIIYGGQMNGEFLNETVILDLISFRPINIKVKLENGNFVWSAPYDLKDTQKYTLVIENMTNHETLEIETRRRYVSVTELNLINGIRYEAYLIIFLESKRRENGPICKFVYNGIFRLSSQ